jgi:hypothetical protein
MIKSLRKRHRQIWALWSILLPVGVVMAWLAIPNQPAIKLLQSSDAELLPVLVKTIDRSDYAVSIRTTQDSTKWQLEWCNKTVLTVPSAVIYKASPNPSKGGALEKFSPENGELIGRIEATGNYIFPLHVDSTGIQNIHLVLFDFIHEKIIDTINFSNPSPLGGGKEGAL